MLEESPLSHDVILRTVLAVKGSRSPRNKRAIDSSAPF